MVFEEINLNKHRDKVIEFRRDSFKTSFGDASAFEEDDYLSWLNEKIKQFPKGFVLAKEDDLYIGQLELTIREYEGYDIGYVHLYYLMPEMRGVGKGTALHNYAKDFFGKYDVSEYHLRVSPSNMAARQFYHKIGMEEVGSEFDGKVIRMKGYL
ncbi:RimJ/RimL family protein N-acetyltransferase [Alkalibacillus salilacus]|uniref:RimJ/RimL family protein N-acetyltransferase n=1 Tax=Alkalibacillus salilacus TaxID=284582 RepID=A0ABT9VIN1_9BACI|nr:RimJ/RimL family protein N-acetyltransferase [Alkalibacillus salilacus]